MKITKITVTVRELTENFRDDEDTGAFAYDNGEHMLCLRPNFQRCFVYSDKKRADVVDSVLNGFPLGLMYWSDNGNGQYECLDGQQRSISICQYVNSDFPVKLNGNDRFFHNLNDEEKRIILDYELEIRVCKGTESEKLNWFRRINTPGAVMTDQELLNAAYVGTWLADAKNYFSKRNCVALQMADGYIKGNPIRQEILEKALGWIADRDGLENGQAYMAQHQHDVDANALYLYFDEVISWAKRLFPTKRKGITDVQDWGSLYNRYHTSTYNSNELEKEMNELILDDDVTKNAGIIEYLLSNRSPHYERCLSLRQFSPAQKLKAYERQQGICPICNNHFEIDEMEGDHIVPWSKGGATIDSNLQMLCKQCNNDKKDK